MPTNDPTKTCSSLDALRPSVAARFRAFENAVLAESRSKQGPLSGIYLRRVETLRTFERSDYLYAQGRTRPGSIVTKAKGGQSRHNYGGATDYCPSYGPTGPLVWAFDRDPKLMSAMRRAAELAENFGLEWGGNWRDFPDLPHFQAAGEPSLAECRARWPYGWQPGVSHE